MRWNAKVGTSVSCLWWNEPKHLNLSETMTVRFLLMILPWFLPSFLAYFSYGSNVYVLIFEKLHVCENKLIEEVHDIQFIWLNFSVKKTPFWVITVACHLRTSELFFLCLRTSKTINLGKFISHLIRLTFSIENIFQNLYSSPNLWLFWSDFVNKSCFMVKAVSRIFPLNLMMKLCNFWWKRGYVMKC